MRGLKKRGFPHPSTRPDGDESLSERIMRAADGKTQAIKSAMTEDQIKHMVNRFLGWKLPENFTPDAGISFKPTFNDHLPQPTKHEPSGTNLFDATQATAMVRYMLEGLPDAPTA